LFELSTAVTQYLCDVVLPGEGSVQVVLAFTVTS
jgi:hypothetical protein